MPWLGVLATNPPERARLRAERDRFGQLNVRVGWSSVPVSTILELIVLAACRGGYRPVGSPDKVIAL